MPKANWDCDGAVEKPVKARNGLGIPVEYLPSAAVVIGKYSIIASQRVFSDNKGGRYRSSGRYSTYHLFNFQCKQASQQASTSISLEASFAYGKTLIVEKPSLIVNNATYGGGVCLGGVYVRL